MFASLYFVNKRCVCIFRAG